VKTEVVTEKEKQRGCFSWRCI